MSQLFNVEKQLTFYGAYHSNKTNVFIHLFGVPLIMWSAEVMLAMAPLPDALKSYLPTMSYQFNEWMAFEFSWPTLLAVFYFGYYFIMEPVAAILYAPQMSLSLLSAIAYSKQPSSLKVAATIHIVAWIVQFIGHGVYEKRAPALLDNLLGAVVLAPFFVHLEMLFALGYRPEFHKSLTNSIGKEITRVKKAEGDKKRAAEAKKSA